MKNPVHRRKSDKFIPLLLVMLLTVFAPSAFAALILDAFSSGEISQRQLSFVGGGVISESFTHSAFDGQLNKATAVGGTFFEPQVQFTGSQAYFIFDTSSATAGLDITGASLRLDASLFGPVGSFAIHGLNGVDSATLLGLPFGALTAAQADGLLPTQMLGDPDPGPMGNPDWTPEYASVAGPLGAGPIDIVLSLSLLDLIDTSSTGLIALGIDMYTPLLSSATFTFNGFPQLVLEGGSTVPVPGTLLLVCVSLLPLLRARMV